MWNCPRCSEELGNYNPFCEFCYQNNESKIYNPNPYYVRDICVYHLVKEVVRMEEKEERKELTETELMDSIEANERMSPQEKLFAKLFHSKRIFVKDMDLLTLRAFREEMAQIAAEAKAGYHAADERERQLKKEKAKSQGFERSVNTDETSTNAIRVIKERQARMSKVDKLKASIQDTMEKAGMAKADAIKFAENAMSNKAILTQVNKSENPNEVHGPLNAPFVMIKAEEPKPESKPLVNPFAKKDGQ